MLLKSILRGFASVAWLATATALPTDDDSVQVIERQNGAPLVFCHFMIGIVGARGSPAEYDDDMRRAKAAGIDAFALNIGVDPYTDAQLRLAYQSAANNGMKVFISFDFNWFDTGEATRVGQMIGQYARDYPNSQLFVDGKVFASSFAGDGLNIPELRRAAGREVFWAPNYHPEMGTDFSQVDSALNWMGWPNNGNNKAPQPGRNISVEQGDQAYISALRGKPYLAPVSPWFFTHFGPEVPYSKNWVFPGDFLWYDRWWQILSLKPRFIELVTWNDYGEAHYIGPLKSPHGDDGNSKWVYGFPHNGWLDMAVPFISAYHARANSPSTYIKKDQVVYWYRPHLKSLNCDATDTTMADANNSSGNYFKGRPNGWETMEDKVFIVTLLTQAAQLEVTVAGRKTTIQAPAGAAKHSVAMTPGEVSFRLSRNGATLSQGTSPLKILSHCPCGIYNFNPFVGTIPAGEPDELLPQGYNSIFAGLKVSTCGPRGMRATGVPDVPAPAEAVPTGTY